MRKFTAVILSLVLILASMACLSGCSGDSNNATTAGLTTSSQNDNAAVQTGTDTGGHPVVKVTMQSGDSFNIELYPEYAPVTVENFLNLVESGFYDGVGFHRVIDGFMAQGGDPDGDGRTDFGAPTIKGEFSANGHTDNTLSHRRGVISMARTANDPDSAYSQFFICYGDCSSLDGLYAAFGQVDEEGMKVVDSFLDVRRVANSGGEIASPVEPIIMEKVEVISR